jgi:hypothetical protein
MSMQAVTELVIDSGLAQDASFTYRRQQSCTLCVLV